ncbi:hypothetical protein CQS04_12155 [Chryseomicrobium excrementi]|uniref:Uncharacterized protein n=1 Tax=Chryseomicrobium excrementi TaxID=2041346 RepID=A0A2M9EXR3_9BACL|nr:hypothetical protein CQS04_12155 [Chryseomicrobium excrementi]
MTLKRALWIIPNISLHLLWIVCLIFVGWNWTAIHQEGFLSYWLFVLPSLLLVNVWGSYRITGWIQEGKL